jgi:hypothetical protein
MAVRPLGPPQHRSRRRGRLLVLPLVAAGWLVIAVSTSAESPSPQASSLPGTTATATPTVPTPGPSDTSWLFATPEPSPSVPLATAPPVPTRILHPSDGDANSCYDCHSAVNDEQAEVAAAWNDSAHARVGVGCADCHGGDPTTDQITKAMDPRAGYIGAPDRLDSIGLCASCHTDPETMRGSGLATDQYAKYFSSVHGQKLVTDNDVRVAVCTDCHGTHDIKPVSDPASPVFSVNVPELCASCHADARRMEPYGIPTDQYDVYSQSVHGKALLEDNDVRAPNCASCHGSHDAKPPTSTTVVEVCGKCHTATQDLYLESRHSELEAAAPKCWTCHGTHDVSQPDSTLFFHETAPDYTCTTCHDLQTHRLRIELSRFADSADRRCDTCHHPDSEIYVQIEGIATAVRSAEDAYEAADQRIDEASRLGMLTEDAEVALAGARTSLIQAQAAVHTTKLTTVSELSTAARDKALEAEQMAQAKVDESVFRRGAMVIVIVFILVSVLALFLVKRRLDRDLEGG